MTYAVDLGKIKFNWQGNYNAATTYTRDDVVYHNGSAYICVVASSVNQDPTTNTAQWNKMAQGSDLGSLTGLAAGSLVYYDGSDFVNLGVGTAGQKLVVNSGATAPEWGDDIANIHIVQRYVSTPAPGAWESNTSFRTVPGLDHTITKQRSDTRLKIHMTWHLYWTGSHSIQHHYFYRSVNGGSAYQVKRFTEGGQYQEKNVNLVWDESIGSAGDTVRYYIQARDYSHNGNGANFHGSYYWSGSGGNVGGGAQHATPYICIEEYLVD